MHPAQNPRPVIPQQRYIFSLHEESNSSRELLRQRLQSNNMALNIVLHRDENEQFCMEIQSEFFEKKKKKRKKLEWASICTTKWNRFWLFRVHNISLTRSLPALQARESELELEETNWVTLRHVHHITRLLLLHSTSHTSLWESPSTIRAGMVPRSWPSQLLSSLDSVIIISTPVT